MKLPGEPIHQLPIRSPRVKGFAPYTPRAGSKRDRILTAAEAVLDDYRAQDRWPLGSREVGYLLTNRYGFTKGDVDDTEDVLVRARQAGRVDWEAISDGRTSQLGPWTVTDADTIADRLLRNLETAQLDRQDGQSVRVEVWAEAASWLARLVGICSEYGVRIYSGSGSVPIEAARQCAIRATLAGKPTVILQIGDLDLHGLRNIARPFEAQVLAFADGYEAEDGYRAEIAVRRLMLTADQVTEHLSESSWDTPTAADRKAGWPWPFKVQAEALPPEVRDQIVTDALDTLLPDTTARAEVVEAETELHDEARRELTARLNTDEEDR